MSPWRKHAGLSFTEEFKNNVDPKSWPPVATEGPAVLLAGLS